MEAHRETIGEQIGAVIFLILILLLIGCSLILLFPVLSNLLLLLFPVRFKGVVEWPMPIALFLSSVGLLGMLIWCAISTASDPDLVRFGLITATVSTILLFLALCMPQWVR